MTLTDYLQSEGITLGQFAKRIGARNARTVQRYTKHGRVPSPKVMPKIVEATGGKVQPNDFFDFQPAE